MQKGNQIIRIEEKETEIEGDIGKYLNKHIAPGRMYAFEDDTNLIGSCLFNIDKPMMVITYKSYEQFIKDATMSELAAIFPDLKNASCDISDEMIAEKQLELVDKPIKYNTGIQSLNDGDLITFGLQMKGHKVILIDDYKTIVEDWNKESPHDSIQSELKKYGITMIAPKHPQRMEEVKLVETAEPVLWITNMEMPDLGNRFENVKIEIVKLKEYGENSDLGAEIKRSLVPSQFYIIEKTSEIALSFYSSLEEPSVIFSQTKSSTQFFNDLLWSMWSRGETGCQADGIDLDDIGKITNALENRPLWIDDSKIHSVEELYEKCLQMKAEKQIQFAVIDDFQRMALPHSDEILWQLCKIAKKFDVVLVGMKRATCNDTDEHHQPRRRKNRNQAKGLDAILRAGYAENEMIKYEKQVKSEGVF